MSRFILYLLRWQLSTPILWLVVRRLGTGIFATVIANLVGGIIFFWVDKFIFTSEPLEIWHIKEEGVCYNCGKHANLWRLVKTQNYDRTGAAPVFLCRDCSKEKVEALRSKGVKISSKR